MDPKVYFHGDTQPLLPIFFFSTRRALKNGKIEFNFNDQ